MRSFFLFVIVSSLLFPSSTCARVQGSVRGFSPSRDQTPRLAYTQELDRVKAQQTLAATHPPDAIFYNGAVLTMEADVPQTQAIAILGNQIVAVGSDTDILALRATQTKVINLDGLTLMPGFVDPHTHILNNSEYWGLDLKEVQQLALESGITTLANMYTTPEFLTEMQNLANSGELHVRTSLYLNYTTNCGEVLGDWYKAYPPTDQPGEMLRIGGVKIFADGGSCGAPALSYNHPVFGYGNLWFTQDELNSVVASLQASGYQAAIHALGDRAVEQAMNAIASALGGQPNTLRHRIEHSAVVRDDLLPRYSQIGIVPLIFGAYPACNTLIQPPPPEYRAWEWRWKDLLNANPNLHFAWHSDTPAVGPVSPLLNLYSMVTPHQVDKDGVTICDTPAWLTAKTITVQEALPMMTIEAAFALFRDDEVGSLKPGKFADLIILSDSPLAIEPEMIKNIETLMTMVSGHVEYCAPGHETMCPASDHGGMVYLPLVVQSGP